MDYIPIFPSTEDLERRRLESTIDQDLYSLSLGSLVTTTTSGSVDQHSTSMSTISSVEQPRGFGEGYTGRHDMSFLHPTQQQAQPRKPIKSSYGPHGTPRAAARTVSGMSGVSAMSEMESPVSTAGHHISAVTLGEGVFRRRNNGDDTDVSDAEFDPERSLGRLVGELGRTMGGKLSPRPTSPFAALSPPRSPSPFSSLQNANAGNMSFTLNRNDPLPSPPASKAGSGSSNGSHRETAARIAHSEFSNIARGLGQEVHAKKRALGESTAHNVQQAANRPADKDRLRSLQGGRKSAPAATKPSGPDITGMTGLMETPAKGGQYDTLGKNGQVRHDDGSIPQALSTLQARLRALETENSLSRRRVRELEVELEKARREVEEAKSGGQSKLRDVISEKSALEDLIHSLRSHLTRITLELEQNKALVSELRESQSLPPHQSPPRSNSSVTKELVALRREVERLGNEVHRLGGIVEEGLDTRRRARGERTIRMEKEEAARMARELQAEDEMERLQRDAVNQHTDQIPPTPGPSRLARGLRTAAENRPPPVAAGSQRRKSTGAGVRLQNPTPPTSDDGFDSPSPPPSQNAHSDGLKSQQDRRSKSARAKRNSSIRSDGPGSPFPSIRDEDEGDFFSVLHKDDLINLDGDEMPATKTKGGRAPKPEAGTGARDVPPQTVLVRVIGELEADFSHYKAIYSELADQYKVLDAASDVGKRRILAEHLKEVIDTLEQKADQIAALYDIVSFSDKPVTGGRSAAAAAAVLTHRSVPDIMRLVRDSLGEEALRRLKEDGLRPHSRRQHCVI